MKKYTRIILCVLLCTSVLLSVCMIEHSPNHNCIGENCQICRDIAMQREIMRHVLLCVLYGSSIIIASQLMSFVTLFAVRENRRLNLVTNKVKLTA